jgi:hypothetical protein
MTIILGIDPGASGALASFSRGRDKPVTYCFDKMTEQDIYKVLQGYAIDDCICYLERVKGMPKDTGKTAFTFGQHYGFVRGVMVSVGLPFVEVYSQVWQRKLGLGKPYPSQPERKRAHRQQAQQWWPRLKITLGNADALLIAEYGYRVTNGR